MLRSRWVYKNTCRYTAVKVDSSRISGLRGSDRLADGRFHEWILNDSSFWVVMHLEVGHVINHETNWCLVIKSENGTFPVTQFYVIVLNRYHIDQCSKSCVTQTMWQTCNSTCDINNVTWIKYFHSVTTVTWLFAE